MIWPAKISGLLILFALRSAAPLGAQMVTLAGPGTMQFTDQQYGVTFRYPARWSYGTMQQFYLPEAILTPGDDQDPSLRARAVVLAPAQEWPQLRKTGSFNGANLVFNTFPGTKPSDCVARIPLTHSFESAGTKIVNGLSFSVFEGEGAGLCHQTRQAIYVYQAGYACYFFDLAVHTNCPPDGGRNLEPAALHPVWVRLESIFATVQIHPPHSN